MGTCSTSWSGWSPSVFARVFSGFSVHRRLLSYVLGQQLETADTSRFNKCDAAGLQFDCLTRVSGPTPSQTMAPMRYWSHRRAPSAKDSVPHNAPRSIKQEILAACGHQILQLLHLGDEKNSLSHLLIPGCICAMTWYLFCTYLYLLLPTPAYYHTFCHFYTLLNTYLYIV